MYRILLHESYHEQCFNDIIFTSRLTNEGRYIYHSQQKQHTKLCNLVSVINTLNTVFWLVALGQTQTMYFSDRFKDL